MLNTILFILHQHTFIILFMKVNLSYGMSQRYILSILFITMIQYNYTQDTSLCFCVSLKESAAAFYLNILRVVLVNI